MRRTITAMCLACGLLLGGVAAPAYGAVNDQPGAGNPDLNPTGKCSPGQNKDTSPGGLKKCPS